MTNEVKEILGEMIINDEKSIDKMFEATLKDIFSSQDNETLIMISETFRKRIEEYKK